MEQKTILSQISATNLKKLIKKRFPSFIPPMLATLTHDYFSNKAWIFEHKFDGERCLAFKHNGKVTLKSRNNKNINREYPELVKALTQQATDNFIIDGEIISKNKQGVSDFELLQGRINLKDSSTIDSKTKNIPITYCVFDILYTEGYDVCKLPLEERKKLLQALLKYQGTIITYTEHITGDGLKFFKKACSLKWEGLIAKKFDAPYQVGKRSKYWLKFKCIMKQELVIGGYTDPEGSREYFGALLVGYYDKNGKLQYAGKVGTGYTQQTLAMLGKKLQKLTRKQCPFDLYDGTKKGVNWVKPELVADFQFAEWTKANKLRVGRYKGLRDDKAARDVVKETPQSIVPSK